MARRRRPTATRTVIVALAVLAVTVSVAFAQESIPIFGTDADETLGGTPANDSIYGRGGDDVLFGLEGDDELDGGPGADLISGGPGRGDTVSYAGGAPVTVTLDGQADDGAAGERDNVGPDVEDVFGSDGNDKLVGSAAENTLDGGGGDDTLTGGAGADGLFGEEGDDEIFALDGSIDRVECGPGTDSALVDPRDIVRDCEKIGNEPVTENFQLDATVLRGLRRARILRLANVASGSRIAIACVRGCRPRSSRTRRIFKRRSVTASGASKVVRVRLKRSPLVAGATFEIGVKTPRARARCRRFRLAARNGRIDGLIVPTTRCTSVARRA